MSLLAFGLIFLACLSFLAYVLFNFLKVRRIINRIPGPRPYFLTGNIHCFKWDSVGFCEQVMGLAELYRNPKMIRVWLRVIPCLVIFGAEEAEALLSSNKHAHIIKGREYELFFDWIGISLLTSDGAVWHRKRKLLTPAFHYHILKDFVAVYNEQAKILVQKFKNLCSGKKKTRIDVCPYITLCALDVICQTAMGRHVNAQQNEESDYVKAIYKMNEITHDRQKKPWLHPPFLFNLIGRGKESSQAIKVVHDFGDKVLQDRQQELQNSENSTADTDAKDGKRRPRRKAFLDLLLDMYHSGKMSLEEVKNEVHTFMFEGHDTTATSMNWTLHLLGNHPEIQERVHQELDEIFGDENRDVDNEDLKHLVYLERCIKESLRLYPSVPIATRKLGESMYIRGYEIPASTEVILYTPGVHRDRNHWDDPEIFDPDRFLPENVAKRHPFAFIPFAAGLRNCIGQRFALMEEKTILAWILRYFRVKSLQHRHLMKPSAELILRPSQGVHLEFEIRREMPEKFLEAESNLDYF